MDAVLPLGVGAIVVALLGLRRAAATTRPGTGLSQAYDGIFRAECSSIPVEFLRALAKNESGFNANDTNGPAWGLLQVVEVVRQSYNRRFGTSHSRQALLEPRINARLACELLSRIAHVYSTRHARAFPAASWRDRRFIELLVFGWNAGYSEVAGTGYVIGVLEDQGLAPAAIDLERVHATAIARPRAGRHLKMPHRVRWSRKVASDYFAELTRAGTVA